MKLCILGNSGSIHVQKWIIALSEKEDIELHVITGGDTFELEKVQFYPLKKYANSKLNYILNARHVKKIIKEIAPDIIHSHYATSYGFLGAYSGFHPFVLTGWGADIFDSPSNPLMKRILQYSFKKADCLTVLTEITRQEMKHLTDKHVSLIPFGVDIDQFKFIPHSNNGEIRIGTIRTLSEKYGVEYLIRAFAILRQEFDDIYLDIIGDGPQKEFLTQLVADLGITDYVIFHGFISQHSNFDKYINLFNAFDIFAILSVLDSETFGVAAVEASACGKAIVASNVGGLPDVVDDEKTGLIVPPKSTKETAEALKRLVTDQELRESLGRNGRDKVEKLYNWNNNVDEMVKLYASVLKK